MPGWCWTGFPDHVDPPATSQWRHPLWRHIFWSFVSFFLNLTWNRMINSSFRRYQRHASRCRDSGGRRFSCERDRWIGGELSFLLFFLLFFFQQHHTRKLVSLGTTNFLGYVILATFTFGTGEWTFILPQRRYRTMYVEFENGRFNYRKRNIDRQITLFDLLVSMFLFFFQQHHSRNHTGSFYISKYAQVSVVRWEASSLFRNSSRSQTCHNQLHISVSGATSDNWANAFSQFIQTRSTLLLSPMA